MALVRCPTHGVPYNDDNPRGCPACWLEREGGEQARVMRELARASQALRRPAAPEAPDGLAPPAQEPLPRRTQPLAAPVTTPPRLPVPEPRLRDRLYEVLRRRPIPAIGLPLTAIFLGALLLRSGPRFIEAPSPTAPAGEILPLPVEPGMPILAVFGVLGVRSPQVHPESRLLERYAYGSDLAIDALNGVVYTISIEVPNRSWHGLRVGLPQREAEGTLALLGPPQPVGEPVMPRSDTLAGWVVYPSLAGRPRRTLKAEVRPPNGCYDAMVDIQPRASGLVVAKDRRFAAVGPPGAPWEWVATRIQVVYRGLAGPAGPAAC